MLRQWSPHYSRHIIVSAQCVLNSLLEERVHEPVIYLALPFHCGLFHWKHKILQFCVHYITNLSTLRGFSVDICVLRFVFLKSQDVLFPHSRNISRAIGGDEALEQ